MPARSTHLKDALFSFVVTTVTAISLGVIFATLMAGLGVPATPDAFIRSTVLVTSFVAVPMAALFAQHELRIRCAQDKLEELASTDPLTGVLNRRVFEAAVRDEFARMRRTRHRAAIVVFDLDHFKAVNDRFGHSFGDEVLCRVAEIAHHELRHPFDKLARWGGEEFAIVLTNVAPDQARMIAERLRQRIAATPVEHEGRCVRVTASFGVSELEEAMGLPYAIAEADAALYRAKDNGRNRVEMVEPSLRAVA